LDVSARIVLTKNLPVASGIGGGSADAAAALRGLNKLFDLGRSDLARVAATLGSDVPVCVASEAAWMEGRGEILTPTEVPRLPMVLVNPRVGLSTAEVFRALRSRSGVEMRAKSVTDLPALLKRTTNDLEAPARVLQPIIGEVVNALGSQRDVSLCRMSGSGATCFGIFENEQGASGAAKRLAAEHPDWWVRATRIAAPGIATVQ
jgi:4-diphosphocytidyl-2-C-methyl-D-erythritol kinase